MGYIYEEIKFESRKEKSEWTKFKNSIPCFRKKEFEKLFISEKNLLKKLLFHCYQRVYEDSFHTDLLITNLILSRFLNEAEKLRPLREKTKGTQIYPNKVSNLFFSFTAPKPKQKKGKRMVTLPKDERDFLDRPTRKQRKLKEEASKIINEYFNNIKKESWEFN